MNNLSRASALKKRKRKRILFYQHLNMGNKNPNIFIKNTDVITSSKLQSLSLPGSIVTETLRSFTFIAV